MQLVREVVVFQPTLIKLARTLLWFKQFVFSGVISVN
jgi:hypothetical protein